jgi:hypothetical protein
MPPKRRTSVVRKSQNPSLQASNSSAALRKWIAGLYLAQRGLEGDDVERVVMNAALGVRVGGVGRTAAMDQSCLSGA